MFEQGSLWRKWDLHVHSPLSILNNQYPRLPDGSPDWEAFVSKLESLDIAVVGITDYFTIDGYKKLKEYKRKGRLANIYTILPNIEFRLNCLVASKKDGREPRRLNFHVIFSDEVPEQDIEEHFLHDLPFFYEGNPQNRDDTRKLKRSNIEALGQKLIEQHKRFKQSGLTPLEVGTRQAVVNHEAITECLKDNRFKGKYLLVLPEELSSLIDWDGQDHHTRKGLLQKSDMVFSSNAKTRAWCLGQVPYADGVDKFLEEFKTLKPCIHGSDAHKLDEVGHPCALRGSAGHGCGAGTECQLRYCWIKADPTYEGLKQLLYEPVDRVAIQAEDPTPVKSNYTLNNFSISEAEICDGLSIEATAMDLNSGLVAVTGGKGSGKTAFVDLIANCYKDRCNTDDPNSFVHRIADENSALDTTLEFKDGNSFKKAIDDGTFFEDSEIVYIAQGELENNIGADSDLDVYIRNLIFESPQVKDTVISFDFDELISVVETIQDRMAKKNEAITTLEQQTSKENLDAVKLTAKQKEAERKDADKRLMELEKAQSKEKIALAQKKQEAIAALKQKKGSLMRLKTLLTEAIDFLDDDVGAFNEKIILINKLLTELGLEEQFDALSYGQKDQLKKRLSATKAQLAKVVADIESAQKELETFETGVKAHAKLLEKKRELDVELAAIKVEQDELAKKGQRLIQALSERRDLVKQLVETVIAQKKKYEEIIFAFSAQKAQVLADLSFAANISFDRARFLQTAEDVLDNRKVTISSKEKGGGAIFDELLAVVDSLIAGTDADGGKYAEAVERLLTQCREKLKPSQAITVADFFGFLYDNYEVDPIVKTT